MKKYTAEIDVMPLKELLDPQGKVVTSSVQKMNFKTINNVRIGKHISLTIDAENENIAKEQVDQACKKLLANPVMEYYEFELQETK